MSWFAGSNPLDELVEKATDSALPVGSEDLALNLEICDRIRSKAVTAKEAMRSLKKRISNKNPNVQLLALNLSDLCVKNGGSHFLVEVASREFVDNMTSLLRAPVGINHEVRQRMIELIQSWALLFEARSTELGYMMSTYRSLKHEGIQFPPEERVAAAFVDTAAPPDWADSDVCMRCRTTFTFRNRKHHCRNCGNVFCGQCSAQSMPLQHLGITSPVRVCQGCYSNRKQTITEPQSESIRTTRPSWQQPPPSKAAAQKTDNDDMELARALELSLAESKRHERSQQPKVESAPAQRASTEDDDADLKAAIEASLRESGPKPVEEVYAYPTLAAPTPASLDTPYTSTQNQPEPSTIPRANPYELLPAEQENIHLFSTLIERLKTDPQGAILRDPQIQELHESISSLRPKLARSLGDAVGKYENLVETHSKLATAIKYYDRMLEARLASTYSRDTYAYDHRPTQPSNDYYHSPQQQYPPQQHSYQNGPSRMQPQYSGQTPQYAQQPSQPPQTQYQQPPQQQAEPKEEVSLIDL